MKLVIAFAYKSCFSTQIPRTQLTNYDKKILKLNYNLGVQDLS